MDYREFEKYVADYAEGNLDDDIRRRMDEARAADSELDRLARAHEQILAALQDTPEVQAPAGLADKIMAEVRLREELLAAERKAFRRGVTIGVGAAAAAAMVLAVALISGSAGADPVWSAASGATAQLSATVYAWLDAAAAWLRGDIELPLVDRSVPAYWTLAAAAISGVLAWFREELLESVRW